MANVDYSKLQTAAKTTLQKFNASPVNIRLATVNTVISTIGVFTEGVGKNIDNRQNPTWITGIVGNVVIVPGIDFVGLVAPGSVTSPQVEGTVEWTFAGTAYKKVITTVMKEEPIPGFPILYTLGIE